MGDTYYEQLYFKLTQHFYHKFEDFITRKWCNCRLNEEISDDDRSHAYKNLYQEIKSAQIANRQTVRKWFGIGGRCSIPSRENVLKIALATKMSVLEATEYLQYGISQPGLQENDYQEFIIMYCLEHQYGLKKCQRMIEYYEQKSQFAGKWQQTSCTSWLHDQYDVVKDYSPEEILIWMHKNQKHFKGYSMTVLNCYRQLVEKCLTIFRSETQAVLVRTLQKEGFFEWLHANGMGENYTSVEIERFVKNKLRSRKEPMTTQSAKEIRNMLAVVYASHDRMSDLVVEIYSTMPGRKKNNGKFMIYNALEDQNQIKRVDNKYISELLNIAILKEKQMVLQMEIAKESNEQLRKEKQKGLKKMKQRVHLIQRSDLLVLAQYIVYQQLVGEIEQDKMYCVESAQREFREFADGILEVCGMRKLDESYMLDFVLLSCFDQEEMYLFGNVIEEMEIGGVGIIEIKSH